MVAVLVMASTNSGFMATTTMKTIMVAVTATASKVEGNHKNDSNVINNCSDRR
jgi:hypothetical protein